MIPTICKMWYFTENYMEACSHRVLVVWLVILAPGILILGRDQTKSISKNPGDPHCQNISPLYSQIWEGELAGECLLAHRLQEYQYDSHLHARKGCQKEDPQLCIYQLQLLFDSFRQTLTEKREKKMFYGHQGAMLLSLPWDGCFKFKAQQVVWMFDNFRNI